ncbi:MAG: hypothetical protein ACFFDX_01650 [Candidatus Odinarchaeota archaeon]
MRRKKCVAKPKKRAVIIIANTESLIEISLPYLVYTIKTVKAIKPIIRKTHAKIHNGNEGTSN